MSSSRFRAAPPDGALQLAGRFVVERCLGEGSMGSVHLAYDRMRGMRVAVKTLSRVDASGIYRFKREFRALADVSHPNLVELYELFSEEREWFFSMEYVEGQDFLSYLLGHARQVHETSSRRTHGLRASLPPRAPGLQVLFPSPLRNTERLCAVLRQITEAVMALHAAGKLHRDLKPDNVLVTPEGRAVVLDFGIAAEHDRDGHGTLEAGVMGTPAYMSPEQAAGTPLTQATDWYSLGVMLFEALTGEVPFDGHYTDVLAQKQKLDPPAPSQLVAGVPEALDALCVRLLSRHPDVRPKGLEILEALGSGSTDRIGHASALSDDSKPPFLGRPSELSELNRALVAAEDGAPVVALVHGMTGMGKSALVTSFLNQATLRGAVTLSGRCYEHELVPFKALDSVVDSLSRYLGNLSSSDAAEVLPRDIHALGQIFPVLKRVDVVRTARRRGPVAPDPRILREQATLALKELLGRIAMRQSLVVFIDDLQWGDIDSARMLTELLRGQGRPAMLLVCAYRSTDRERSPGLSKLLELLRGLDNLQIRDLPVRELSEQESLQLSTTLLGQGAELEASEVARESRGSPYLIEQLVHHVRNERAGQGSELDTGSRVSLGRALSERLDGLSSEGTHVLEMVAVSGRPVREQVLTWFTTKLDLAAALSELRRAKLLRGVGTADARAIAVYHESIREAVLARMEPATICEWHKRLAAALESSKPVDVVALIDHLVGAGEHGRAGIYAIGAARTAMAALAFDEAAELYEIAARYHDDHAWRQELLVQWAEALVSAGRSGRAAEIYLDAAAHASKSEATLLRVTAGTQLLLSGHFQRGAEVLTPALDELGVNLPRTVTQRASIAFAQWIAFRERGYDFVPTHEKDVPQATLARLDALWSVVQATLSSDPMACQVVAVRYLTEALDAGEKTRIVVGLCATFVTVELAYSTLGNVKARSLSLAETLSRDMQDIRCRAWVTFARAFAYLAEGLIKPASMNFAQAEELLRNRCSNVAAELRSTRMLHARTLGMLCQFEELARCDQWVREAVDCEDVLAQTRLRMLMIPALLIEDDVAQVKRALKITAELQSDAIGLTGILWLQASVQFALYRSDGLRIQKLLPFVDAASRSPLLAVRVWHGDLLIAAARLRLAASAIDSEPHELIEAAAKDIAALEKLALECHFDHVRMLRATLVYRRGNTNETLSMLDALLADTDMGGESSILRACAQLSKGVMIGGASGDELIREGTRSLKARGMKKPLQIAGAYAPGLPMPEAS